MTVPLKKEYMIAAGAILVISIIGFIAVGKTKAPASQTDVTTQTVKNTFPIPTDTRGYTETLDAKQMATANFQTGLSIADIQKFYTKVLTKKGLVERTITTSKTDTTLSIVFDGAGEGYSLVIQSVWLSSDMRNVNIRYEKIN